MSGTATDRIERPRVRPGTGAARRRRRAVVATLVVGAVAVSPPVLLALRGERGAASFGDSESVGRNRLAAARLDVEVGERTSPVAGRDVAPGDVLTGVVELVNAGTVPLRYSLTAQATGDDGLGPWSRWTFVPADASSRCPDESVWRAGGPASAVTIAGTRLFRGSTPVLGDPATGDDAGDRVLEVGQAEQICVAVLVALDAPNSVQSAAAEVAVTAHAEQLTAGDAAAIGADTDLDGHVDGHVDATVTS